MYKIKGPPKAEKLEPKEEEEKAPSKFSFHINKNCPDASAKVLQSTGLYLLIKFYKRLKKGTDYLSFFCLLELLFCILNTSDTFLNKKLK